MKYLKFGGALLWLVCSLYACKPSLRPERPMDPWVFRSVLDQRPRMITLAFDEELYAAFDAQAAGIYKLWKGGIHIDGAPFNGLKTIQPSSWGIPYALDSLRRPTWRLQTAEGVVVPKVVFKGYRLLPPAIRFAYALITPQGDSIQVQERLAYVEPAADTVGLSRTFTVQGLPPQAVLSLHSMGQTHSLRGDRPTQWTHAFARKGAVAPPPEEGARDKKNVGRYWLTKSGCNTCHEMEQHTIGPGYQQIAQRYEQDKPTVEQLTQKVKQGGKGNWGDVPMIPHPRLAEGNIRTMVRYILAQRPAAAAAKPLQASRTSPAEAVQPPASEASASEQETIRPGFGHPLAGVHPSYDLFHLRPKGFTPKVAAMDFMPDGSLLVATWDSLGAVYRLRGVTSGDSSQVRVKRIAAGLAEPLGMKVVGSEVYVMQKHELTQLIDHDGDEVMDEYRAVCSGFDVSTDFHEYALDLAYRDGYFYTNLSLPMRLMAHEHKLPDRGRTIRIHPDGRYEWVNHGLRQPNGLEVALDGELFLTDNQGSWVPANKLIHVQEGQFHGCRKGLAEPPRWEEVPPAVWLPQDEIGNSPSEPLLMKDGPYAGQMIHGEVTHGGIKRVFLERVGGEYQGCVFRFTQGLEAGINRMVWGPDGGLYVGGVGMNGNWGWQGRTFGLQKLMYNGQPTFEMLRISARADGFAITFTQALAEGLGESPQDYALQQWRYVATKAYGGPKVDLEALGVQQVRLSDDRRTAFIKVPGLKTGHVVYLRLAESLTSESGQGLWSSEAWYTFNRRPASPLP